MFDIAEILVRAGNGGNGAVSFRREKGVPKGGPNGGNGGRGGDVFLIGRGSLRTLLPFQHTKLFIARSGENGKGKDMYGKGGEYLEIEVPLGTSVYHLDTDGGERFIGEIMGEGERLRAGKGGEGGRGNAMFTSSTQQAPYIAEKGVPGDEARFRMELRLIADVGIIGKPNAGKSTLLSAASAAHPKIASYPFTTTEPQLGVVDVGWRNFVLAEIPGLLEGAHLGIGLGHEFLRHATRTRFVIHLVDGSGEDVLGDLQDVNDELNAYGAGLDEKPQIIAVNKMDMREAEAQREALQRAMDQRGQMVFFLSAAGGTGVQELMREAARRLSDLPADELRKEAESMPVLTGRDRRGQMAVRKEDDVFVVLDERAIRLVGGSNLRVWAGRAQLKGRLDRMGVTQALEDAGIEPGDTVRFGTFELEW